MVQDIYEPLNEYVRTFRDRFRKISEETFDGLALEASVDAEANRRTCSEIYKSEADLCDVQSKINWWTFLCVVLWIGVAACVASIFLIKGITVETIAYIVAGVVFLLLLILAVRLVFFFIFRTRRCNKVLVPSADGSLIVTRKAIESVVRAELAKYAQITVRKLVLYRRGKRYSLKLFCLFSGEGAGLPKISQELKPRIREVMNNLFGIETMAEISICIERMTNDDDEDSEERADFVATEPENDNSGL